MSTLTYVTGDATDPQGDGHKAIIHVCNNVGAWGAGFVLALDKRWSRPKAAYLDEHAKGLRLGEVSWCWVDNPGKNVATWVVNMIAQKGVGPDETGRAPIRYGALAMCLHTVGDQARRTGVSLHAPRFGAGLAGGHWPTIEALILECIVDKGVPITIYDLP